MAAIEYDYMFKILLVGDSGVGKSNVIKQFTDNAFTDSYHATIGVDFTITTINVDGKTVKLQLWDTAGEERFRSTAHPYYGRVQGIILVYDVSDRGSFDNLPQRLEDVMKLAQSDAVKILVGNKSDLTQQRSVEASEAESLAQEHGFLTAVETSAKDSINIHDVFFKIAQADEPLTNDPKKIAFIRDF